MTTHWLGCLCGIMTWEAPRSTMKLSSGSTDLWSRRCGTLTLRILTSQPLSGQHVHGSLPQVNLGHSCYCTYNTSTLACCWCVGRLRTQRVGLASGEQPGVTVRLSSVALLGCRIASPTCTVLRACESSLVWPGQTQCRLVAYTHRPCSSPRKRREVQPKQPQTPPASCQQGRGSICRVLVLVESSFLSAPIRWLPLHS